MHFRPFLVLVGLVLASVSAADVYKYRYQVVDSSADPTKPIPAFYYADTAVELPAANEGDLGYAADTAAFYVRGASSWAQVGGTPSGAPTDATYLTQTASGSLSAEQAMGLLGTGLVKNTTTTGVQSIFGGYDCPFYTSGSDPGGFRAYGINADGSLKCTYVNVNVVLGTLPAGNGGTGQTTPTADSVMVGNGSAWNMKILPLCADSLGQHLNYDTTTDTFSCGNSTSGSADWTMIDLGADFNTTDSGTGVALTDFSIPFPDSTRVVFRCVFVTEGASSGVGPQFKYSWSATSTDNSWTRTTCSSSATSEARMFSGVDDEWDTNDSSHGQRCNDIINGSGVGGTALTFTMRSNSFGQRVDVYDESYCEYRSF